MSISNPYRWKHEGTRPRVGAAYKCTEATRSGKAHADDPVQCRAATNTNRSSVVDVRRWIGEGEIPWAMVRAHQIAALVGH